MESCEKDINEIMPEIYWIIDHEELAWAPGVLLKDHSEQFMHVQCIVDEEFYEIEKPPLKVIPEALLAFEDLCETTENHIARVNQQKESLEYQSLEASILHSLRQRYSQNQIDTRIDKNILLHLFHKSQQLDKAQYFFEQNIQSSQQNSKQINLVDFIVTDYLSSIFNFGKHIISNLDFEQKKQRLLLIGQFDNSQFSEIFECLISHSLPLNLLSPPQFNQDIDTEINQAFYILKTQIPIQVSVLYPLPQSKNANILPYFKFNVSNKLYIFQEIQQIYQQLLKFECLDQQTQDIFQKINDLCDCLQQLTFKENNKKPGVLPLIKLSDQDKILIEDKLSKMGVTNNHSNKQQSQLQFNNKTFIDFLESANVLNLSKPQKLSNVKILRDVLVKTIKTKIALWYLNTFINTKTQSFNDNNEMCEIEVVNEQDIYNPVQNCQSQIFCIIKNIDKLRNLLHQQCLIKNIDLSHLKISKLLNDLIQIPQNLILFQDINSSNFMKIIGEQIKKVFSYQKQQIDEMVENCKLSKIQKDVITDLIQKIKDSGQNQSDYLQTLILVKAIQVEQSQSITNFLKKFVDALYFKSEDQSSDQSQIVQSLKQSFGILQIQNIFEQFKPQNYDYNNLFKIISVDPTPNQILQDKSFEDGQQLDSFKIIDFIQQYNLIDIIDSEIQRKPQRSLYFHEMIENRKQKKLEEYKEQEKERQSAKSQHKTLKLQRLSEQLGVIEEESQSCMSTQRQNEKVKTQQSLMGNFPYTVATDNEMEYDDMLIDNMNIFDQIAPKNAKEVKSVAVQAVNEYPQDNYENSKIKLFNKNKSTQCEQAISVQYTQTQQEIKESKQLQTVQIQTIEKKIQTNLIVYDDAYTQTDEIEKKLNEDEYFLRKEIENMKELYYLQMQDKDQTIAQLNTKLEKMTEQEDELIRKVRALDTIVAQTTHQSLQSNQNQTTTNILDTQDSEQTQKISNQFIDSQVNYKLQIDQLSSDLKNIESNNLYLNQQVLDITIQRDNAIKKQQAFESQNKQYISEIQMLEAELKNLEILTSKLKQNNNKNDQLQFQNLIEKQSDSELRKQIALNQHDLTQKNEKYEKVKKLLKRVSKENDLYNQTITILITIKKAMQKESSFTFELSELHKKYLNQIVSLNQQQNELMFFEEHNQDIKENNADIKVIEKQYSQYSHNRSNLNFMHTQSLKDFDIFGKLQATNQLKIQQNDEILFDDNEDSFHKLCNLTSYRSRINSDSWDKNTFKKIEDKKSLGSNDYDMSKLQNEEVKNQHGKISVVDILKQKEEEELELIENIKSCQVKLEELEIKLQEIMQQMIEISNEDLAQQTQTIEEEQKVSPFQDAVENHKETESIKIEETKEQITLRKSKISQKSDQSINYNNLVQINDQLNQEIQKLGQKLEDLDENVEKESEKELSQDEYLQNNIGGNISTIRSQNQQSKEDEYEMQEKGMSSDDENLLIKSIHNQIEFKQQDLKFSQRDSDVQQDLSLNKKKGLNIFQSQRKSNKNGNFDANESPRQKSFLPQTRSKKLTQSQAKDLRLLQIQQIRRESYKNGEI